MEDQIQQAQAHDHDPRFDWVKQHGGPSVRWVVGRGGHRRNVEAHCLDGWGAFDYACDSLILEKHLAAPDGLRMIQLACGDGSVRWSSSLEVGEGRYARMAGNSLDFHTALREVETCVHESREMGGLIWWGNGRGNWVSWLGQLELRASEIEGENPRCVFSIAGKAPTLKEAAVLVGLLGR